MKQTSELQALPDLQNGMTINNALIDPDEDDENFWINGRHPIEFCESEIIEEEGEVVLPPSDNKSQDYKCCYCSFMGTVEQLQSHTRSVHSTRCEKTNSCTFCFLSFESETALRIHVSQEHAFYCKSCKENFQERKLFLDHLSTHNEDKRFKCPICDRTLKSHQFLLRHLGTHETRERRKSGENLEIKKIETSRSSEHKFSCSSCSKVFMKKGSLSKHMKSHLRQEMKCSQCEFSSPKKIILKMHEQSHLGDRKHKCEFCSYSFKQHGHLKRHIQRYHAK